MIPHPMTPLTWAEVERVARVYGAAVARGDRERACMADRLLADWLATLSPVMRFVLTRDLLQIAAESVCTEMRTDVR
jgi:hypothetical protein